MRPRRDSLYVWTGPSCVYGCRFCPIRDQAPIAGLDPRSLHERLSLQAEVEGRLVILLGGEPLLNPELGKLGRVIRRCGFELGLVTTGRPLVYRKVRNTLRELGLRYLRVQFFGVGAEHDGAVEIPGAFEQVLEGVRAWVAEESTPPCDVDLALDLQEKGADVLRRAVKDLERLSLSRTRIVSSQFPLAATRSSTPSMTGEIEGGSALRTGAGLTTAPVPCGILGEPLATCLGVTRTVLDSSSRELQTPRANSFNFIRSDHSIPFARSTSDCIAAKSQNGGSPIRTLWLRRGERMVRYESDTGDFSDSEVGQVKEEFSHLFIDHSKPGVLDDFVHGMGRVLPDAACRSCDAFSACGHRYFEVAGPPFATQESWIARHVEALRGKVLDVGCGEQLYRSRIAPLLRDRLVTYTGLDPDARSLASAREALPEGRFRLGGIEEFCAPAESYDQILCLRSLNHVQDLDEAMARMADLLKPGGALLIVECTPFAMLRDSTQVDAADRALRAGHQHYRNIASTEVLPFAYRRGLKVRWHDPASLQGTNQWVLLLEKE